MNGNTPVHEGGQSVPLKEYIEALIAERDKAVKEAIRQMEMKLVELNALRRSVEEDRNLLLTRDKFETEHGTLEGRVNSLESWRGKALGFGALLAFLSAAVGALLQSVISRAFGG